MQLFNVFKQLFRHSSVLGLVLCCFYAICTPLPAAIVVVILVLILFKFKVRAIGKGGTHSIPLLPAEQMASSISENIIPALDWTFDPQIIHLHDYLHAYFLLLDQGSELYNQPI